MKSRTTKLLLIIFFGVFNLWLYKIYQKRVSAFGCFDDCFNYLGGYFLLKGKHLYSEIFFNHQPLMAWISWLVQKVSQPINVYELLRRHRQLVFVFGWLADSYLIWRFGWLAFGFAVFYETTKFYLFGDRFLAEGIVVYLLVALAGLMFSRLKGEKLAHHDYLVATVLAWLIIYARLPYIPVALASYLILIWERPKRSWLLGLVFLGLVTLTRLPLKDYFFNVVTLNLNTGRLADFDLLQSFFYPVYLLQRPVGQLFSQWLFILNIFYLALLTKMIFRNQRLSSVVFLTFGLANIWPVAPGKVFYGSFHLLPWYGLLVFLIFWLCRELKTKLILVCLIGLFAWFITSPRNFLYENVNPHEELIMNFGPIMQTGETVKKLSSPEDTLFLDGFDDLLYWQAQRLSAYPYAWYTSVMPHVPLYASARLTMFAATPPDFYYGACPDKEAVVWTMPVEYLQNYVQLFFEGRPTCLYVKKTKLAEINADQWEAVVPFATQP